MQEQSFFLEMDDQTELFVRLWAKTEHPRAVLQIAHGMAEHSGRYARFARALNRRDIVVSAADHRGHGHTGERAGLMGYFAPENGFERVVDDQHALNLWLQREFEGLPVFLLGHSMGSFLARRYIQMYGDTIQAVIILGSAADPGLSGRLGRLAARIQMRKDPTRPSKFLDRLSFGAYNRGISKPSTKFDWLSRDQKEVQKYEQDPFCGFVCSPGFFYDLLSGLSQIHDPALSAAIPKDLPMLVMSGGADPVGKMGKGVEQFVEQYRKLGLTAIKTVIYPESRHELLNESNRAEVTEDILLWLEEQIN